MSHAGNILGVLMSAMSGIADIMIALELPTRTGIIFRVEEPTTVRMLQRTGDVTSAHHVAYLDFLSFARDGSWPTLTGEPNQRGSRPIQLSCMVGRRRAL